MPAAREAGSSSPRGRPSIRQAQKAATFDLLLDSAWELYVEQGYESTTVEQIAAHAGASRATFYLHFDKKSATVVALLEARIVPETLTYYQRLESFGTPTREQLRGWLDSALDFYDRHRVELDVLQAAASSEPELAHRELDVTNRCADVLTTFLRAWGPEGEAEARTRVSMLILQLSQFANMLNRGQLGIGRETAVGILLDFWSAGLSVPHEPADRERATSPAVAPA